MQRTHSSLIYLIFILFVILLISCGGGGGDNGGGGKSATAIEPDPPYTGSDCSCGKKTSEGSGMTLSASKSMFPSLEGKKFVSGEVLVKFRQGTSQARAAQIMNSMGSAGVKSLFTAGGTKNSLLKKIKLMEDKPVELAVKEYKGLPEVEYAEPNYIYRATAAPNDPDYSVSWGLNNTGQTVNGVSGNSGKDIDAETAWNTITNCSSVIVAVLDTGINYNHRDLSSNMWSNGSGYHGYDYVDNDNYPMDQNGHGTHCAGIIGAKGNDSTGLAGVCWNVKLMAVRVLDSAGNGNLADIADGIHYAIDNGAHIISASLGGPASSTMQSAVVRAYARGVIIIAAAGNEATNDNTFSYPAAYGTSYDNIISVAAVDQNGNLAEFSNWGTGWVDIAAPGVNILSTWPGQHVVTSENFSGWAKESGWGTGAYTYPVPGDLTMLTNPSPFGSGTYAANLKSMAYANFDLNAYNPVSAVASFYIDLNIEEDRDYLVFMYNTNGGRPDPDNSNSMLGAWTGYSGGLGYAGEGDLTSIMANNASLGFFLYSDYVNQYSGAGVAMFDISRLYSNTTACIYANGTSMAAPHVAGVAAMCIQRYMNNHAGAYDQNLDYVDVINAILNGAADYASLNNYVTSNRMLNAPGALAKVDLL